MAIRVEPGAPVVGFHSFTPHPMPVRRTQLSDDEVKRIADRVAENLRSKRKRR